jgi:hypothetical protein
MKNLSISNVETMNTLISVITSKIIMSDIVFKEIKY